VGLKGIQDMVQQQAVDVIGVLVETGQIGNVPLKTGGQKARRNVQIGDESGLKIQLTLWGNLANQFDLQVGQVLAVKNAKVSDFGGKSLNSGDDSSLIYIAPDHARTHELQKWHASNGDKNLQSLSGAAGEGGANRDDHRLIKEMMDALFKDEEALRGQGQPHYFKLSGYVSKVLFDENR